MANDDSNGGIAGYEGQLRRYLRKFGRPWYPVDDLVQDTYVAALTTIRNRGPPERMEPWLWTVAKRTAYRRLRQEQQQRGYGARDEPMPVMDERAPDPADAAIHAEDLAVLDRALPSLAERDQHLLERRYHDGQSCGDLGRELEISVDAAKVRLYRARKRLREELDWMDDIEDVLRKLRPILGEQKVRELWEWWQLSDGRTKKYVEFSIRQTLAEATGAPFSDPTLLAPIPAEKAAGPFALGRVRYGTKQLHEFSLRPEELIQHTAIFGRSGAGKTNVAFLLLREIARQNVPFLVFDWKRNYRDLLPVAGFEKLVVYTLGRNDAPFFFNPLIPPGGIEPQTWLKKLIEIMQHAYFLGDGVAYLLQEALHECYESQPRPTFRDLLAVLERRDVRGREGQWMESALRAARVLTYGDLDWVLNTGAHLPMERLLKQQAVLELEAFANTDKQFLIETLLLWIHHHRMREPGRERLKHVLVIEEAHHILLRKAQQAGGAETVTDLLLREIREYGEAIVLLDQVPSLISKPALENTFTTIAMNLKEQGDITAAAGTLLLDGDQRRHLGTLDVGTGVVKLQARWPRPFLVTFPPFPVQKGAATDALVNQRFKDSLDFATAWRMISDAMVGVGKLATQVAGIAPPPPVREPREAEDATPAPATEAVEPAPAVGEQDLRFLRDVHEHPTSPVTERYERLSLTAREGTVLVRQLVERGLLESATDTIPGTNIRLLQLTPAARKALGLPEEETSRWGGPEHRLGQERILSSLEGAEREAPCGGGKTVDILVATKAGRIGIEVETGRSDWEANVRKCLDAGLHHVIVAATRPDVLETIKAEAQGIHLPGNVRIVLVEDAVALVRTLAEGEDERQ